MKYFKVIAYFHVIDKLLYVIVDLSIQIFTVDNIWSCTDNLETFDEGCPHIFV